MQHDDGYEQLSELPENDQTEYNFFNSLIEGKQPLFREKRISAVRREFRETGKAPEQILTGLRYMDVCSGLNLMVSSLSTFFMKICNIASS